ncbi:hypothetical protein MMC09_006702 [Bachmanniomyces sp. S44760]|nr:hypothetical protein [Bachmanniomyces sp. S44760]
MKYAIAQHAPKNPIMILVKVFQHETYGPKPYGFLAFIILYLLAIIYCQRTFYRDVTSAFFDSARGYDRFYSFERQTIAEAFISSASRQNSRHKVNADPRLCLGVTTVSRPNKQYIGATVGSLLENLTDTQRAEIYFILFIAHTDPAIHPSYGESWTQLLPDTLLTYDSNVTELEMIHQWEIDKLYRPKGLYDYSYLLQKCYETGAPYVAMVEGDVIATGDWYVRAMAATDYIKDAVPFGSGSSQWLYLRMFYTEAYLGWNREDWLTYLSWSLIMLGGLVILLLICRTYWPTLRRHLTNATLAIIVLACLPACIGLFFMAGRMSMRPLQPGVHRMEDFGCCSQGFVFRRAVVPLVLGYIRKPLVEYIDMLMEIIAESEKLVRWVIVPSLLQHVGGESSKGDEIADSRAKMIWNFAFETYATGGKK